jgi:hypothetical protein
VGISSLSEAFSISRVCFSLIGKFSCIFHSL